MEKGYKINTSIIQSIVLPKCGEVIISLNRKEVKFTKIVKRQKFTVKVTWDNLDQQLYDMLN